MSRTIFTESFNQLLRRSGKNVERSWKHLQLNFRIPCNKFLYRSLSNNSLCVSLRTVSVIGLGSRDLDRVSNNVIQKLT